MTGEYAAGASDREPVLRAGGAAALVNGVASLLVGTAVLVGWLDQASAPAAVDALVTLGLAVVSVVTVAAPIVAARRARSKVTPVAAPAVELDSGAVVPAVLVPVDDGTAAGPYGGQYAAG